MNELTTTSPADIFRAKASDLLTQAATMSLHELVDEFQRLTALMDENVAQTEHERRSLNETGALALRERKLVGGAARARFGIDFEPYDRVSSDCGYGDF